MKKFFLLLIVPLVWAGCSKDDDTPDPEQEVDEVYIFDNIKFFIAEGDGVEEKEKEMPEFRIENRTDAGMLITHKGPQNVFDTSTFSFEGKVDLSLFENENMYVTLPNDVSGTWVLRGGEKGLFSPGSTEYILYTRGSYAETVTLPEWCAYVSVDTVYYRKIRVSFTATFVGQETGKEMVLSGKWEGNYVHYVTGSTVLSSIEK